jgi:hypothetical protein
MAELRQSLTEKEILSYIGALQINLQLANQNLQILLQENIEFKKKIASLENNTAQQKEAKKD